MPVTANASEFAKNFGRYRDLASAERVVEVSSNGRPVGAFLSQAEYERYLDSRRRQIRSITPETAADIIGDLERAQHGSPTE